ncbi:MAG: Ig-like domain-containing protein [Dehalococcoidia bacterium]
MHAKANEASLKRAWWLPAVLVVVAVVAAFAFVRSTSAESTATNGIYDIFVEDAAAADGIGVYTAGTGPSHPVTVDQSTRQNVLYNGDIGDAWSSYTTVRSYTSATDYVQTVDGPTSGNTVSDLDGYATGTTAVGSTGYETTYDVTGSSDDLQVTQRWNIIGTTLTDSIIELTTTVENTGSATTDVGIRYQWDIQMSCDDGPTFTPIDGAGNPVGATLTTEGTFAAPTFPAYRVEDNDCPESPLLAVFGTAGASGLQPPPTPPELLMYADWGTAYSSAFDYTTDPNNSGPDDDSAILYFYGATPGTAYSLGAGETVTVRAELFAGEAGAPPPVFQPTPTSPAPPGGGGSPGGGESPGGVDVTISDDSVAPGDTVDVTATATDADGNPVVGAECTFRIYNQPGDDASVEEGPVTTDENGQATAALDVGSTIGTVEVLATCGAFAEVLAVDVGVGLPSTGGGGASSDASNWLLLAAGLAALGLGALSLRMRRG